MLKKKIKKGGATFKKKGGHHRVLSTRTCVVYMDFKPIKLINTMLCPCVYE
jgi:hypothetical protein